MATHQATDQHILLLCEVDFSRGRLPSWISIDWKILMSATQNLDPRINE